MKHWYIIHVEINLIGLFKFQDFVFSISEYSGENWRRREMSCAVCAVTRPAVSITEWHLVMDVEDSSNEASEDLLLCKYTQPAMCNLLRSPK